MKDSPVKASKVKAAVPATSKVPTKVATKKAPAAAKKMPTATVKKAAPVVAKKSPATKKTAVVKKAVMPPVAKKASSKTVAKKTVAPVAPKTEKPARRPKQRDVRNRVIALLETGPMTTPALMKGGKFSQSALYLNLKALRESGTIQSHRTGKSVTISLTGKAAPAPKPVETVAKKAVAKKAATKKATPKVAPKAEPIEGELIAAQPKPSADLVPAVSMPRHLHEALSAVRYRLSPIERAQEKLIVLDELARTMPEAVAEVLRALMDDVSKLSGV